MQAPAEAMAEDEVEVIFRRHDYNEQQVQAVMV